MEQITVTPSGSTPGPFAELSETVRPTIDCFRRSYKILQKRAELGIQVKVVVGRCFVVRSKAET